MRIALLGTGHLGKIHLKCILATECWELAGFYDPDDKNATSAIAQYGAKRFKSLDKFLPLLASPANNKRRSEQPDLKLKYAWPLTHNVVGGDADNGKKFLPLLASPPTTSGGASSQT